MKKILSLLWGICIVVLSTISCTFAYTQEQREAYEWAYKYKITTQPTIEAANLNWNITRQAFAKMIVNYLEIAVWVKWTTSNYCSFPDEDKITSDLKPYTKKTCSYSIMWSNWSNFNPMNPLTKAHLWTVLSRILWWDKHNSSWNWYYIYHVNALQDAGIMDNINNVSEISAKRWEVLVMLKRMYDKFGSNIYMNWGSSIYNTNETTINSAIDYNDQIVDLASQCIVSEDAVWDVYDDKNAWVADIQKAIKKSINECNAAKENINKLGDWEGDASLKNGVLNIINKEIAYFSKFSELLPYLEIEAPTEKQEKAYNNLLTEIEVLDRELAQANENLITIQEQFSKNHGFELEADKNNKNDNISSNDSERDADLYSNQNKNIVYVWKDWTAYDYNSGLINLLIKTADQKWESDLVAFLKIESDFLEDWLEMDDFDEEEFAKELWIDLDNLDRENMTKKEKEELVDKFGAWVKKLVTKNKDRNNKFIKDLEKVVNKVRKDDKFQLQEKYEKSKTYIESYNWFLDTYAEMITNLMKLSVTAEEWDENEEAMGQAFALIWIALAYQSNLESYQAYLNEWATNAIKLLGLNS